MPARPVLSSTIAVKPRWYRFPPGSVTAEVLARLRVLILAGISVGVVVAGAGSRAAMLVLRLTSPDRVIGVTSDDGFTIGRVTLGGTYSLLVLGAVVGIIGAAAYQAVAPWLLGPVWFRRLTVSAASGAVVGSMLVHADGVDFTLLKPLWLAVGMFVALPALFGWVICVAVDRANAREHPAAGGRGEKLLLVGLVVAFPLTIPVLAVMAAFLVVWVPVRRGFAANDARFGPMQALAIRGVWLTIAMAGLLALVGDIRALT